MASIDPYPRDDLVQDLALFLCRFDNTYGRALAWQEPAGALQPDEFDAISDFLIPKPQLFGQLFGQSTSTRLPTRAAATMADCRLLNCPGR